MFYDPMRDISIGYSYRSSLIHSYLFAWPYWSDGIKSWHSVKEREAKFFAKVSQEFGDPKATLYSIAKVLNEIGYDFIEEGVGWLCNTIENSKSDPKFELETNTIFYLEVISRRLHREFRMKIKTSAGFRTQVLTILNFLVDNGSVAGYMLREDLA